MSFTEFIKTINHYGTEKIPFLFLIDFEMKNPRIWKLADVNPDEVLFDFNGVTNATSIHTHSPDVRLNIKPAAFEDYSNRFDVVMRHLEYGDSYLTNLTVRSEISLSLSLREIFHQCKARYKFLLEDSFLVFSPEIFVQIKNGKISSFPMKGTIDASIPNAKDIILKDQKELAEHVTIVDLIRNDLSMVAGNVQVARFRYTDEIQTQGKKLIQVSSEITGDLPFDHLSRVGNIIAQLLPAGSVSGAPKAKTVEIIRQAEAADRGYYTGVAGFFDGNSLDTGVLIRYIEKQNGRFYYRSGGGITTQSNVTSEYQEAIDKIYVPLS